MSRYSGSRLIQSAIRHCSLLPPRSGCSTDNVNLDPHSARQLLLDARNVLIEAYENQDYPYYRLLSELDLVEATDRCPLFDVSLSLDIPMTTCRN